MTGRAYLHFGNAKNPPMQTLQVPARRTPETPRKGATLSGYGRNLPTPYMVLLHGRWRRVRVAQYGNAGTAYVPLEGGEWAIVQDIET